MNKNIMFFVLICTLFDRYYRKLGGINCFKREFSTLLNLIGKPRFFPEVPSTMGVGL